MTEGRQPPERLHCAVSGCRRTRLNKDPVYYEWVCQKCYVIVPAAIRCEHKSAKAEIRKLRRARCDDVVRVEAAFTRADAAWEALLNSASRGLPDEQVLREMGIV
jgi:hypothetical protein